MNDTERFLTIAKIVDRAQAMGIGQGDRITQVMDVDNAAKQFNMRLTDWLNGSNFDFAHDYVQIQNYIDRTTGKVHGLFVPRFAGRADTWPDFGKVAETNG